MVIGDLISPFKSAIGLDYGSFESRLQGAVHRRFGLVACLPEAVKTLVKRADRGAAFLEAVQIAGFEEREARRLFLPSRGLPAWSARPFESPRKPSSVFSIAFTRWKRLDCPRLPD